MADPAPTLDSGTYEVVRQRLDALGATLLERVGALNAKRLEVFGAAGMQLLATEHVRTEHNCIPRDILAIGDRLILGYQVHLGLKSATAVGDVFAEQVVAGTTFTPAPRALLTGAAFEKDFAELFQYYKNARLLQLVRSDTHVLAAFQTGQRISDVRVLRWALAADGAGLAYVDNRGAADYAFPPSHDFTWVRTTREDHVQGAHPHVNILDTVFVESIHGDVTIKIENNTATGTGILSDPVKDTNQGLDDAEISYAKLESCILIRIRPYRENEHRHYVYNILTHEALRIDAIGASCQQLPEGHGLIFPGGYYLASGVSKVFPQDFVGMQFVRAMRAPNGEDLAYIYYEHEQGVYIILRYNLITREVEQPQVCNGYTFFADGRLVVFRANPEPARLHAMQVWQTPFVADETAAAAPPDSPLGRIGNRELVRGISDLRNLQRLIANQRPTREAYADLLKQVVRIGDSYHWLDDEDSGGMKPLLGEVRAAVNAAIGEFEKVLQLTAQAAGQVAGLEAAAAELLRAQALETRTTIDAFVLPLAALRRSRGAVASARTLRHVDAARLDALDQRLAAAAAELAAAAVAFLLQEQALASYHAELAALEAQAATVTTVAAAQPPTARCGELGAALDLLVETVNGLDIADATARTGILERIAQVYAGLNRVRALLDGRRRSLGAREGQAAFAAQLALLAQAVANAVALCATPEACDEFLGRLMLQLEELDGRFADVEDFTAALAARREEVYETLSARKQALLDERQRRADGLGRAAERVIGGIAKRAISFATNDELNAYFAADAMVLKARTVIAELRGLGATVRADDCEGRIKAARETGARALRDRGELFEGEAVKLGRHRFSVNTQALELTMLARAGGDGRTAMWFHLVGSDYFSPVEDAAFAATSGFWTQELPSENHAIPRCAYLAWQVLAGAEAGAELQHLAEAATDPARLLEAVRAVASQHHDHGYERGIHDADAARIVAALLQLRASCGLLRFPAPLRAAALLAWATGGGAARAGWVRQARALGRLRAHLGDSPAWGGLAGELAEWIAAQAARTGMALDADGAAQAGAYLAEELARPGEVRCVRSGLADDLLARFATWLQSLGAEGRLADDLRSLLDGSEAPLSEASVLLGGGGPRMRGHPAAADPGAGVGAALRLAEAWLAAFAARHLPAARPALAEAAAWLLCEGRIAAEVVSARTAVTVDGLLSQHPTIVERQLEVHIDTFAALLRPFATQTVPAYRAYQEQRRRLLDQERTRLRCDEFVPKVLTSFVRNRLISEVYLPLIGDNLAKQTGALGDAKRTDLMGLLLLISPPGYGKTTLMEYVASVLGLAFVKINGPALGHGVRSLDPAAAPDATARQELEKLGLGLEMGNNVMIVIDDIQHCHAEFLQKFISLCDGSRRIEGVWRGRTRTYDLRGKKVAVVMAGNPYTESGERFRIPDMLANRADTYNLGDILGGHGEAFALSYLENSLTANPQLAALVGRPPQDLGRLLRLAAGDDAARAELEHPYSALELGELTAVLTRLQRVQRVLLTINQTYIASAAQADDYRTEPPFKLQGSYRNMAKIAAKVVPLMSAAELEAVILDHYRGESQTLTTGAEVNLLKLKALLGVQSAADAERWAAILQTYTRRQDLAGADDPASKAVLQLAKLGEQVGALRTALHEAAAAAGARGAEERRAQAEQLDRMVATLVAGLAALRPEPAAPPPPAKIEIVNTLPKYYANLYQHHVQVIEQTLIPAVEAIGRFLGQSTAARDNLTGIASDLRSLIQRNQSSPVIDPGTEGDAR